MWLCAACGSSPTGEDTTSTPPTRLWEQQLGNGESAFARAVAADGTDGAFVVGYTDGAFTDAANAGAWDAFVIRVNAQGEQVWARQWGSDGPDFAQGVAVDGAGSVFVAGYGNGLVGAEAYGRHDAFLAKYDADGKQAWLTQWGTADNDYVYGAAADPSGAVLVAGYTEGALGSGDNAGDADAFVSKVSTDGAVLWTAQWGTPETDYAQSVAAAPDGSVYATGYTAGALSGDENLGSEDVFLSKLSADGELLWTRQWGSATTDYGLSLAVDSRGAAVVVGYTYGAVDGQEARGGEDAFLTKVSADGEVSWTRQWGTLSADNARAVLVTTADDILVTGDTQGMLGSGANAGERDTFLSRFTTNGELLWTEQWGSDAQDFGLGLARARDASLFVAGYREAGGSGGGNRGAGLSRSVSLSAWDLP